MNNRKFGIGTIVFVMLVVSMMLVPAVSAQEVNDYNVTAEEAFKHANANMINFIAICAPNFENWKGACIDPKPQELYDINGQKLFYQFSVYKEKKLIGTVDVFANKTLGHSINDITFDPKPYKAAEAMQKSEEIAKEDYPTGEIKLTVMVVYSYPSIGAMTVVKDKSTGVEHRVFVDAYNLDEKKDKPATETEPGVWSMYDQILKNGKENNLNECQKSDQLTKYIERAAAFKGVNISVAVTEQNAKELSGDAAIMASTSKKLGVPLRGQEDAVWCGPACIQMISLYYRYPTPTQKSIYYYFPWANPEPQSGLSPDDMIKIAKNRWNKNGNLTNNCNFNDAKKEIDSYRPFYSMTTNHYRVCQGYLIQNGYNYLYINDPMPIGSSGTPKIESTTGGTEKKRIYIN